MEYQKIINLIDNTPNQQTKFSTKIWVEINDDSPGTYITNSQIKFNSLCPGVFLSDHAPGGGGGTLWAHSASPA